MAAHLLAPLAMFPGVSEPDHALASGVGLISNGAPAALFAVLGGVSIVFATRKQLSNGLTGKAMASVAAVSYTHLDVYKRQVACRRSAHRQRRPPLACSPQP